ncbi:GDSL-type esterase/lipase family protein [Massilia sp. Root351]|uniref:GDSL-type esterase/lipase family protein n=1 Tax=Massilia sp. Root351 TaxID=1736522 RepID=UPI000AD4E30A|nr:GDSL-type esterase/lipase family protein [Massilia sp. Root351]
MNPGAQFIPAVLLAAWALCSQAAGAPAISLYAGKPVPSWQVTVAGFESPEQVLRGGSLTLAKPADSYAPNGMVGASAGPAAGKRGALTLRWKDAWFASLRLDGGAPLDLRPYLAAGTLEFDINVRELSNGGMYVAMRCGPECNRKVPYVLPGRALQGKGWQRLSFSLSCFAREKDDFSQVPMPFALEGNGAGEVAVANVKLVRKGKPNAECPDYRTVAVTPAPLTHAWALGKWEARHEQKLAELRKLKEAGKNPGIVFIGDSITEGWEKAGLPVWKRYYEQYNALALGFGGDHTENVLWRLRHGEIDGIAPKVAVLMIGTNNAGDRQDEPEATAAGIKAIVDELRRRLPDTKVLLLAIFPRDEQPSGSLRRLNERVNKLIAGYADGRQVFFANLNAAMLNPDGSLPRELMPDMLHPGEKGYEVWARELGPHLEKLLADAPEAAREAVACATNAAPRTVDYPWMSMARWRRMHEEQAARAAQGDIEVMFVGDSLTEMWPKAQWDANFGRLKAANFGIGGDHTGNLLWRLRNPAIAALTPRLVVLMIGVNNINLCGERPEQVFTGIQAVVARLRQQYPGARILLNAVLPEGALPDAPERRHVAALNQMVKTLDDGKNVFFHDYGARFVGADGKLSAQLQPDFLHMSEQGYQVFASAIRPDIERLLKAEPAAGAALSAPDDVRALPPPPPGFADPQPGAAQGTLQEFAYQSVVTGTQRKASVYLPAGYSAQRRYPVLYLLHGIGGSQDEWRGYVRANAVLDRLIAGGEAVPMIVVMPNGRALADDRPPPAERTFSPGHVAAFAAFERDLLESLIPAIDKAYPTLAVRGQRAIAGLSMGGGQALNFGLGHLDTFAWVGGFSSAPNTRPAAVLLPDPAAARRQLQLLYLSCGSQDGLIGVSQQVRRYLREHGVPHVWNVDGFGHDRDSWAENLHHFARLIFRPAR